jgi:hypothetical protein
MGRAVTGNLHFAGRDPSGDLYVTIRPEDVPGQLPRPDERFYIHSGWHAQELTDWFVDRNTRRVTAHGSVDLQGRQVLTDIRDA